ncbi:MAG: hypothetical protein WCV43_03685 [Candidatus Caldatribacteriota bacterium]|jgi:pyruvate/oxaloacetate carboxyltransferase|nr:hypothetical protein [Atribacterota bacterium]
MNIKKKIKITDKTLRDSHKSLLVSGMTIKDILPSCEKLDQVGFCSM